MNGKDLYEHLKNASKAFGLNFWEMDLITVKYLENKIIFSYENIEYAVVIK